MLPEHRELAAELGDLLSHADTCHYQQVLTDMWEGWLCSPDSSANSHLERAEKLEAYKRLSKLLEHIGTGK